MSVATFRPEVQSRRAMLAAMAGLVLDAAPGTGDGAALAYCSTPGRDVLASLEEASGLRCGTCKEHAMLGARRAIDAGARHVELCMTVSDDPEEHVFCRVDGALRDFAVEAGMPVRQVGDFIAVTVWRAPAVVG